MYQFRCPEGHEFEKIVQVHQELHKWCKHCDKLTVWVVTIGQKVCSKCMGNEHLPPVQAIGSDDVEKDVQEECPTCGKASDHVLKIETRGFHKGTGPTVSDSSIRFHFNYPAPSDN